jgi:hypothetical protein
MSKLLLEGVMAVSLCLEEARRRWQEGEWVERGRIFVQADGMGTPAAAYPTYTCPTAREDWTKHHQTGKYGPPTEDGPTTIGFGKLLFFTANPFPIRAGAVVPFTRTKHPDLTYEERLEFICWIASAEEDVTGGTNEDAGRGIKYLAHPQALPGRVPLFDHRPDWVCVTAAGRLGYTPSHLPAGLHVSGHSPEVVATVLDRWVTALRVKGIHCNTVGTGLEWWLFPRRLGSPDHDRFAFAELGGLVVLYSYELSTPECEIMARLHDTVMPRGDAVYGELLELGRTTLESSS